MPCGADGARADEFGAWLAPYPLRARKHPRRAMTAVVAKSAHDSGVPVPGQRNGRALLRGADGTGADELRPLLTPYPVRPCEHPRSVSSEPPDDRGVPVAGE